MGIAHPPVKAPRALISNTTIDVIPRALQHSCAAALMRDLPGFIVSGKNQCQVPQVPCLAPRMGPVSAEQHEGCCAAHGVTGYLRVEN